MPRRRVTLLVAVVVGVTVVGMLVGAGLLLLTEFRSSGWLVFIPSFGGRLAAAQLAAREGRDSGWFDRRQAVRSPLGGNPTDSYAPPPSRSHAHVRRPRPLRRAVGHRRGARRHRGGLPGVL